MSRSYAAPVPGNAKLAFAAIFFLLFLGWLGIRQLSPPAPLSDSAHPSVFSAARAMKYLDVIAAAPHPTGTTRNTEVRNYLVAQLTALGYSPTVQSGTVVSPFDRSAGTVHNILVRIPGTKPGKAVMLTAHYDSAPSSPGAADDGASVAAIMETLRAIRTGARLQNDLLVVLSDAEEVGLLGARYFSEQRTAANDIGLVLNFEFRGNSGPFWMFETSMGNGKLIEGWKQSVAAPFGNSLLNEVYRHMPNNTDLTVYKKAGLASLNFAAGEGHNSYHTQLDRPDLLDQASLQHEGETMLGLVKHFGNTDLGNLAAGDRIYFGLPGIGVVSYPAAASIPLFGLTALCFVVALVLATRTGAARPLRAIGALPAMALCAVLVAIACQALWMLLCEIHPGYRLLLHGNTYNGTWYLAAFTCVGVGLFAFAIARLKRWFTVTELSLGGFLLALVLAAATSIWLPGASFLFVWPLLPMLLASIWTHTRSGQGMSTERKTMLFCAAAAPGVLIFTPVIHLLYFALTAKLTAPTVLVLMLLLCMLAPLLQLLTQRFVFPMTPLLASLALVAGAASAAGFNERHPQPNNLFYMEDSTHGKAYWISRDRLLDAWTHNFFPKDAKTQSMAELFGPRAWPMWVNAAPLSGQDAPSLTVREDRRAGGKRYLSLEIASARKAPRIEIAVEGANVLASTAQQVALVQHPGLPWSFAAYGMGDTPIRIDLVLQDGAPFAVRVADLSYGL
ncbi:MAG TPA: M28 family peptidase, partial [Duganella sp.]|nr:M28 family peptidase [Duganella sp.]